MNTGGTTITPKSYFKLGLLGYPVSHSLSPLIHQSAMKALGIEGEYRLYPIAYLPEGKSNLESLLEQVREGEVQGLNVTIPHKQNVLTYMDELSESASAIGAVNTIYMKTGRMVGDNTDADGFWADLQPRLEESGNNKEALVLGAGGSARAIVYALYRQGWHITVATRRVEQAIKLARDFEPITTGVQAIPLTPHGLRDYLAGTAVQNSSVLLIVNTTPAGMFPEVEDSPWYADIPFPKNGYVLDLVYNPAETALIKAARAQGLPTSNGLGMLVEQAALSLELWTGLTAPREAMRATLAQGFANNREEYLR